MSDELAGQRSATEDSGERALLALLKPLGDLNLALSREQRNAAIFLNTVARGPWNPA